MKLITGKKGSGKTTELITESAATGRTIVTQSDRSAKALFEAARAEGIRIPYPMTYDNFIAQNYDWRLPGLLIDDLDDLLKRLSRVPVYAVTVTEGK